MTLIPYGKETECLGPLPVEVLFADQAGSASKSNSEKKGKENISGLQKENDLLETLDRWGVRNLHALAALPDIALGERLGQDGLRLQQLARGAASRTLVPIEVPAVFEEAIELEFPIVLLEPLAFLLNRLLDGDLRAFVCPCAAHAGIAAYAGTAKFKGINPSSKLSAFQVRAMKQPTLNRRLRILFPGGKANSAERSAFHFPCSMPNFFSSSCNWI